MPTLVRHITVDSSDPYTIGLWWSRALEWSLGDDDEPGDPEALVQPPAGAGPGLLFVRVPEPKTVKNRIHIDLQPQGRTRDEDVERLITLGATQVADQRRPDGSGWVVLQDPEGNEFCVERSAAERAAAGG